LRLGAQWLESYIICQVLLATAWVWLRFVRAGRSPGRKLWLARTVLLSAVLTPVLVRGVEPPRRALLPAVISLDEMPRLDLARIVETPVSSILPAGAPRPFARGDIDPLRLCWTIVLLGGLAHLSRTARDLVRIGRLLRRTAGLRSVGNVRVVVSAECRVPFSVAFFGKAYVVVPTHMLASPSHARMAIVHELQHHRQGDCWTAYVLELLRAVFFWSPGIHLWRSSLGELQEFSCDEALIGRRHFEPYAYGRCLLAVAQAASPPIGTSRKGLACVVGMAREGGRPASLLQRRIRMLSHYRSAAPRPTMASVLAAAVVVTTPLGLGYAAQGTLTRRDVPSLDLSRIDPRLQRIAELEVKEALTRFKAKSVAVVVAQPQTGTVVAFAEAHSQPTAETWARRAFAPGSTSKPFVVTAALEAGAVSEGQMLDCRQPYEVGGRAFNNHDPKVGKVSTTDAIAQSVNVCTLKMAQAAGKERVRHTLQHFGLDWKDEKPSAGKDLSADDADAVLGVTLPASLATMIRAYSMLANHGRSLASPSAQVVSEKTADAMVRMLVAAVDHGTGTSATLARVAVAGKTGTVVSRREVPAGEAAPVLALFGGFAPAKAPRLVAFVIVEGGVRGQQRAGGGAAAAPTFREVMDKSLAALDHTVR
jgi:beta-lactamase regulating signal transducer with metallopeptidase domain